MILLMICRYTHQGGVMGYVAVRPYSHIWLVCLHVDRNLSGQQGKDYWCVFCCYCR